ncbi:hypothetical protein EJB05_00227, partial [Eragrostis curvula]
MPPRKRSRDDEFVAPAPAEEATRGCPLPAELLLEIVARSNAATLLRCAASCRSLRRDILHSAFIHHVCNDGAVPPRLLGFLGLTSMRPGYEPMPPPSFSLAYPATHAAASLSETHLAPFLSRDEGRLASYETLTSRDGLVLLRRNRWVPQLEVTLCVYDVMTGKDTFFPGPPKTGTGHDNAYHLCYDKFVLLTSANGVGCPFLIFAADFSWLREGSRSIIVWTFFPPSDSDAGGAWSPATFASHSRPPPYASKEPCDNVAVLHGGLVHWLIRSHQHDYYIFTYNVLTAVTGWIELPAEVPAKCRDVGKLHLLASSPPTGTRLSLLVVDKFKVSVWLLLSSGDDGACWAWQTVIDMDRSAYSVSFKGGHPYWPTTGVDIVGSGTRCSAVILLWHSKYSRSWSELKKAEKGIIVLDLETKEMREVSKKKYAFVYEVDMASRLAAMKIF